MTKLAWGAKVPPEFWSGVMAMCGRLVMDPNHGMAVMAFETGETFRSDIRNAAGSGAVGLIQFMPGTCASMGVTVGQMASLTPTQQLAYVERYFKPWAGRLKTLGDVYGAVLWPAMIGKPDDYIVFDQGDEKRPKLYIQNKGLDYNKDGKITRKEIVAKVQAKLDRGLLPQFIANI